MRIIIISAVAENGVIGKANGEMPWHISEEFRHFKETTLGSPIIMGRKTFDTLGKPLKGRENIIVSKNKNLSFSFNEVKIFDSLENSIEYCRNNGEERIFIIGGGQIYRQAIHIADELIISFMKFEAEGEIKFPEISDDSWIEDSREDREKFEIVKFVRKS